MATGNDPVWRNTRTALSTRLELRLRAGGLVRASGGFRFAGPHKSVNDRTGHVQHSGGKIDVTPFQSEQLALSNAGRRARYSRVHGANPTLEILGWFRIADLPITMPTSATLSKKTYARSGAKPSCSLASASNSAIRKGKCDCCGGEIVPRRGVA
jgi:hypothetical protein